MDKGIMRADTILQPLKASLLYSKQHLMQIFCKYFECLQGNEPSRQFSFPNTISLLDYPGKHTKHAFI